VLQTNGSGTLSWTDQSGGGGSTQSGWHGSGTQIKIYPTEFMGNDVGRAIVSTFVEDDVSNTLGVRINNASGSLFAFNEIPTSYKATHVKVYTQSNVTGGVEVFEYNHQTGAVTSKGTGTTNTSINITDITSSATASIVIEVAPGSITNSVFGADITLATV